MSVDAEQAVVGACLIDPAALDRVGDIVRPEDFTFADNRRAFEACIALASKGQDPDVTLVAEKLGATGQLLAYIGELAYRTPSSANVVAYAQLVASKARARALKQAAKRILELDDRLPTEELLDQAQALVMGVEIPGDEGVVRAGMLLPAVMDGIEERFAHPERLMGLPTGYVDLDRKLLGLKPGNLIVLAGRPSMGKAQPLTEPVLLQDGAWKAMGDLRFGDRLASLDGKPSVVSGIYPRGAMDVFKVTFSDGRYTRASGDHLWSVDSSRWSGGSRVLSTEEIQKKLTTERYQRRITIPMVSGDFGVDGGLLVDPWLLGALIANGCMVSGHLMLSTADAATLYRVQTTVGHQNVVSGGAYDYRLSRGAELGLAEALQHYGLMGKGSLEKFIPPPYLRASRNSRLELLRGLLDTDGWVESFGAVRYATSSEQLAGDVQALVRSLGGVCTINHKAPTFTHNGERRSGARSYVLNISHPDRSSLLTLMRKQRRTKATARFRPVTIVSVEPDGREPVQCISVTHPSRIYVTRDYITTHNTALAMNIAGYVARKTGPALVCSLEMSSQELVQRALSAHGRISLSKLYSGKLEDDDWPRITAGASDLHEAPLYISETPAITMVALRSRARRLKAKHGLSLIVVDYLQLMTGQGENRTQQVGSLSSGLKALSMELHVPVMALSQLNRSLESRENKRPKMSDLRESGQIEQDADVIMFLYRDEVYDPESQHVGLAELNIAKQRNGPIGQVWLTWLGEYVRFESAAAPTWPAREKAKRPMAGFGGPKGGGGNDDV